MAHFTRKTFNDAYANQSLGSGPSSTLQFLRNRRDYLGGGLVESLWDISPPGMAWGAGWGLLSAPFEAGRAVVKSARFLEQIGASKQEFASPLVDTRMAYTMRQAALNAMHNSAYSLRGAIGNEANLAHY